MALVSVPPHKFVRRHIVIGDWRKLKGKLRENQSTGSEVERSAFLFP